ncbi:MAG: DEAD/DEAH box helicase [Pseudomonadota bacterium]
MSDFSQFGLPAQLNVALERMQYSVPTPIQKQAIPLALKGHDILGSAQTGTGKTAAFGIPLVAKILNNPRGNAIVLTPTRELATQVMTVINGLLGQRSFVQAALLIGGDSMHKQTAQLRMRPRIIIGTPGRINDHLERGNLILHDTNFLVLDETDRMLDMGFGIQIDRIVKFLPAVRQTLMFSATIPAEIVKMSAKYLKNPERIAVGSVNAPVVKIQQEIIHVNDSGKYDELSKQIAARTGSIIVFVKTKRSADKLSERLNKQGNQTDTIHGDLHQRKREKVIQGFRNMKFRILVATDIAARGLDIPHIEHVINYDLPQCPEDYIHRIGRTGRNGSEGSAVCLISPDDGLKWRAIHRLMHPNEAPPQMPHGSSHGNSRGGDGKPRSYGQKKPFGNRSGKSSGGNSSGGGDKSGNNKRFSRFPKRSSAPKAAA